MPRGRRVRNADFLETLEEISGHETVASFARACGKQTQNMSRYLRGTLRPGTNVIKSSAERLYGWQVRLLSQVQPIPTRMRDIPTDAGIYVIYDSAGNVLYLGKATNLRAEVRQTPPPPDSRGRAARPTPSKNSASDSRFSSPFIAVCRSILEDSA
jgi:Nuclease subunit of the excinuclease complex